MKPKNKKIYGEPVRLAVLAQEYEEAGFDTEYASGCLTVLVYRRKKERTQNQLRKSRGLAEV